MQHSEDYGRSAKSFIAHLTALCCGVEAPDDRQLYLAIPRWLDGAVDVARPDDIPARGRLTVLDVQAAAPEDDYPDLVRRWAQEVWMAYAAHHAKARDWLNTARSHGGRQRPRGTA
jgi:hypothetical protein